MTNIRRDIKITIGEPTRLEKLAGALRDKMAETFYDLQERKVRITVTRDGENYRHEVNYDGVSPISLKEIARFQTDIEKLLRETGHDCAESVYRDIRYRFNPLKIFR